MSRPTPIPYFPVPPREYNTQYFAEVVRAFSVYTQQMANPGPWRATELTLTQSAGNVEEGILTWNTVDETVDITMGNGVVQQVGFETYIRAKNNTGSTIPNGTVVGFAGVGDDIEVSPYIASSIASELYFVGVTTYDMVDQALGPVTIYGKVRGLDTSGFSVGDIVYASPSTAGALTNVRPTAPNVVIPVAAVLTSDATDGEIVVRPTIPMGMDFGRFSSETDQTLAAAGTANAEAITFDTTLIANGVSLGTPASRLAVAESGYYQIDMSLQLTSSSSSAKTVYIWLKQNGANVPDSTRIFTSDINNGFTPLSLSYSISMAIGDYVELFWASSDTSVSLNAVTGLTGAPDAPSVIVSVNQLQL